MASRATASFSSLFASARFRSLGTILRSTLFPISNADGIQCSTDHVISNTGQVFHTAASNKDNRVFLKIVTNAGDVGGYFNTIGKSNTSHFAQCRIGFLRGLRVNTRANTSFLR